MNIYHFNANFRNTCSCIVVISDPMTARHAVNLKILNSDRMKLPIAIRYAGGEKVGMTTISYYKTYFPDLPFITLTSTTISTKD